jgi:hypothetical protein
MFLRQKSMRCRHGIVFTVRWRSQASDFGDINGEIDASNVAESYRCDSKPRAFNAPFFLPPQTYPVSPNVSARYDRAADSGNLRFYFPAVRPDRKCRMDVFVEWCENGSNTHGEISDIGCLGRDRFTEILIILSDFLLHSLRGQPDLRTSGNWPFVNLPRNGAHYLGNVFFKFGARLRYSLRKV